MTRKLFHDKRSWKRRPFFLNPYENVFIVAPVTCSIGDSYLVSPMIHKLTVLYLYFYVICICNLKQSYFIVYYWKNIIVQESVLRTHFNLRKLTSPLLTFVTLQYYFISYTPLLRLQLLFLLLQKQQPSSFPPTVLLIHGPSYRLLPFYRP